MFNFIDYSMLNPNDWGKILRRLKRANHCSLARPEIFILLYPLVLSGAAFPKFIVARYVKVMDTIKLEPFGMIEHGDHPLMAFNDKDRSPSYFENLYCLAAGRLSHFDISISGVLHSWQLCDEETNDWIPSDLEEAGTTLYESVAQFGDCEPEFDYKFINFYLRQTMTTEKNKKNLNPFFETC